MSKVIRISDLIYQRLQVFAVPFEDTPASIIERLLDFYESKHGDGKPRKVGGQCLEKKDDMPFYGAKSGNWYSIEELENIELGKDTAPIAIKLGGEQLAVRNWTELCEKFAGWLLRKDYLKAEKMPVPNHARKFKYFINSKPQHMHGEKDGQWKQVGPYFVDTKYNADAHAKNIRLAIKHLGVRDHNLKILFA